MTIPDHQWSLPPTNLTLPGESVHVWRASLEQVAERVCQLSQTLSYDEMARANRFRFERDQRRFIVARGVLRTILGRYLDIEPGQLQFRYGPYGKPYLADGLDSYGLRFNLAHSHELALYALGCGREIGIDLEYVRPIPGFGQIAASFFSKRENAVLNTLPRDQELEAFYNCWTRKEAFIKARGEALSLPLDSFDVSMVPGEPASLLRIRGDPEEISHWSLRELMPGPNYVATLVVAGPIWRFRCWQWPE
jgi:4'-phosphopantetheinyl transferase